MQSEAVRIQHNCMEELEADKKTAKVKKRMGNRSSRI